MNTSITNREALRLLYRMRRSLRRDEVLRLCDDYRFHRRQRWGFRSSNECVTSNRIVVEMDPSIPGLEGHTVGIDHEGRVYIALYGADVEMAWPVEEGNPTVPAEISPIVLNEGQKAMLSHVLELASVRLMLWFRGEKR